MKLSAPAYRSIKNAALDESFRRATPEEHKASQVVEFAVIADDRVLDDIDSPFFAKPDGSQVLSESELATLDGLLASHGLRPVLLALAHLLESRVEASLVDRTASIYKLAETDIFAYAAQRVTDLTYDSRVKTI